MREYTWKKAAIAAMKQHGFKKNAINHTFYCEWPHCLAATEFERNDQMMRIRFDMHVYAKHDLMNLMEKADYCDYLTYRGNADFPLDEANKAAVYDRVTAALRESVPRITANPD